ncbi:hypothetical protein ETH_00018090, partial [Eimeria tenella]
MVLGGPPGELEESSRLRRPRLRAALLLLALFAAGGALLRARGGGPWLQARKGPRGCGGGGLGRRSRGAPPGLRCSTKATLGRETGPFFELFVLLKIKESCRAAGEGRGAKRAAKRAAKSTWAPRRWAADSAFASPQAGDP